MHYIATELYCDKIVSQYSARNTVTDGGRKFIILIMKITNITCNNQSGSYDQNKVLQVQR